MERLSGPRAAPVSSGPWSKSSRAYHGTQQTKLLMLAPANLLCYYRWAKCLNDAPSKIPTDRDHSRFRNVPGQFWGAKRQCEVLLRDRDATLQNPGQLGVRSNDLVTKCQCIILSYLQDICENLRCKTPHRSGFYFAGPALEGTECGSKLVI